LIIFREDGRSYITRILSSVNVIAFDMPIVTVAMYTGRTQTEKDRLAEAITDDVVEILKVEKKDVTVVFQEASHGNWYNSGIRL
jgi:4-oxalocrotonate tautomerase